MQVHKLQAIVFDASMNAAGELKDEIKQSRQVNEEKR